MPTKVISAKPGKKSRKYIHRKTTDQKIKELRNALGLNDGWENFKFQMKMMQGDIRVTE